MIKSQNCRKEIVSLSCSFFMGKSENLRRMRCWQKGCAGIIRKFALSRNKWLFGKYAQNGW